MLKNENKGFEFVPYYLWFWYSAKNKKSLVFLCLDCIKVVETK